MNAEPSTRPETTDAPAPPEPWRLRGEDERPVGTERPERSEGVVRDFLHRLAALFSLDPRSGGR